VPESQVATDENPQNTAEAALKNARYMSEYSITAYLIGVGNTKGDTSSATGMNGIFPSTAADDGKAGDGIRHPGRDKSWGGASNRDKHNATTTGRVLGPYLDIASLGDDLRVDPNTGMYRLYDAFDSPIRYYRYWPKYQANSSGDREPSLDGVPIELLSFESVGNRVEFGDPLNPIAEGDVFSFEYMLVSAGVRPAMDSMTDPMNTRAVSGFGDVTYDAGNGAFQYIVPGASNLFDLLSEPGRWRGTRKLLETNIRQGS